MDAKLQPIPYKLAQLNAADRHSERIVLEIVTRDAQFLFA